MTTKTTVRAKRPLRFAECFVAACSGTARLSEQVGHPVVHVGISNDAERAIADLNAREYGSGTLWPKSFQPLEPQSGWSDWAMFPLEPILEVDVPHPLNAEITDGLIRLPQPAGLTMAELREQMSGALSRLRFHDVVRQPCWLEARSVSDPLADIVIHPRYVFSGRTFHGAKLVTDLVVLDPTQGASLLLWMLVGACIAAGEGGASRCR